MIALLLALGRGRPQSPSLHGQRLCSGAARVGGKIGDVIEGTPHLLIRCPPQTAVREPGVSTSRVERYFDAHASDYDRQIGGAERWLLGRHREWATSRAAGMVLELAVGTGLNLALYPDQVEHVLGVDLSEGMLDHARARLHARGMGDRIEVRHGDVQHLDLADASVDTVLATYTLCTVPNPRAALIEARRVLRPGGRLLLVEHGPSRSAWVRAAQRALNPLTVRWQVDDLLCNASDLATDVGFEITHADQVGVAGLVHRVDAAKPTAHTRTG